MVRSLMLVLACATLIACARELTSRERLVEAQRLQDRLDSWVTHMNNAKTDSIFAMYDSSSALLVVGLDGQTAVGPQQVREALRGFFGKLSYMNFGEQDPKIDVLSQDIAVVVFRHSTDIVQANRQRIPVQAGPGSMVWVKDSRDNLWKIHTQHLVIRVPSGN